MKHFKPFYTNMPSLNSFEFRGDHDSTLHSTSIFTCTHDTIFRGQFARL